MRPKRMTDRGLVNTLSQDGVQTCSVQQVLTDMSYEGRVHG